MTYLLACLLAPAPFPPRPPSAALLSRTHDFARLNHRLAQQLQGKRVAFRVLLESSADEWDGCLAFGCAAPRGEERSLVFAPGALDEDEHDALEAGQTVTVEAELAILTRGAWVAPDGSRVPGFTEYRLVGARLHLENESRWVLHRKRSMGSLRGALKLPRPPPSQQEDSRRVNMRDSGCQVSC